jgi:hypothetical protein
VTIYSGAGIVRFVRAGNEARPIVYKDVGFCPGTTLDLALRTRAIEVLPEEREDLQW